jgi:hypothetical protein
LAHIGARRELQPVRRLWIFRARSQRSFTPAERWKPGDYELVVDLALEDLVGNRIGRPFDVDLSGPAPSRIAAKTGAGTGVGSTGLRFQIGTR